MTKDKKQEAVRLVIAAVLQLALAILFNGWLCIVFSVTTVLTLMALAGTLFEDVLFPFDWDEEDEHER